MSSLSATTLVMLLGASTAFAQYPTAPAAGDACAAACVEAYRTCQSDSNNTRAECASELSSCVGYVPFDNSGSFATPTACSITASATPSSSAAPTSGGGADACAANCVTAFRTCQSDTSNTRAQCASELSSCVGYVPFDNSGSFVTPTVCSTTGEATATATPYSSGAAPQTTDDCAASCVTAYDACRVAPDADRPLCASDLASCVGYNPFDNSGTFVTPTACSSTSAAPTQSKVTTTAPAPTTTGSSSSCAQDCIMAFRTCQSDTSNNRSLCASDLATCVGYNPFDNSGSFVTPTACSSIQASKTANPTVSMPAVYTGGAVLMNAGGSFAAVAAGAVALMI